MAPSGFDVAALGARLASPPPVVAAELGPRPAAVALILVEDPRAGLGGGAHVLLLRRAERAGDPWSGHMALPGGRAEPGDADLLATACRETFEETGVQLTAQACLGALSDVRPRFQRPEVFAVRPFVFHLPRMPAIRLGAEASEHYWVDCARLKEAPLELVVQHRGQPLTVPGQRVEGWPVWGLTWSILEQLRARL